MKPARESGKWRFLYVQANGMADTKARHRKVDGITKLINAFDINGAVLCETGVNWGTLPHDKHMKSWFDNMMDREIKVNTAHNIHGPKTATWQPGGTGMLFMHELLQYARSRDNDFRGLGRWSSWTLQSNPNHRTRVVVAYCPGNRSKNTGLTTVANQHMMYIDEHNLDTRSPYRLFVQDLSQQLRDWRATGDRILLFIDANEPILTGELSQTWKADDIDLREITHKYWPDGVEPHSFAYGSRAIDGIYATPDIDVTSLLSLSFQESVGDHRSMIIEISTASAIGKFQGKIVQPTTRRLTTKQKASVEKYNHILEQQFAVHNIPARVDELDAITKLEGFPASPATKAKVLSLLNQIDEIRIHAEQNCRKLYHPALPFSPSVKRLYDRIHAFRTLIKIMERRKGGINVRRAHRTARRCGISNPHGRSIQDCLDGIADANWVKQQLVARKHTLRREHLRKCLDIAHRQGKERKVKDIRQRMAAEHSRNTWRTINRVTRPAASRSVLEVQELTETGIVTHNTQQSVEQAIQRECNSRFHLGHSAPIAKTLLGDELQYLRNPDIAHAIISGTYIIPPDLDEATKLLLTEISKLGRQVLRGNRLVELEITGADYIKYWRRVKESTSSSPSGLHLGHYKACTHSSTLPDTFAKIMNITIRSGVHPLRWGTALQVLLEKVAGVCLVDKLRSIQLYEADLNWFMKFVFNDKAMEAMNESGYLPEEHFSQKESMAEDACLDKTLTMDISRQARHPMAVLSLDAAQCYDRVHPIMMSLVWLALLNHLPVVSIMLTILQSMKFHTRTGFGDSATFFGGDPDKPACGLGQGSKAAPAAWIQISSMIVNAFKSEGFGAKIIDPITMAIAISIGCLYVDDTDIYVWDDLLTSSHSVWKRAQAAVDLWARLLMATGGAIKAEKSFWYLLDYEQVDGEWQLIRHHNYPLQVPSPNGPPAILQPRQPDDSERTLGVLHAPCGGNAAHFDMLYRRLEKWVNDIKNGHLPSTMSWLSYEYQLWPGIQYALGTLSNDYNTAARCFGKLEFQLLPLLGVNRHIAKGRRHLHRTFGGVGLLSLPVEQVISRCNIFLQHYRTPSSLGKKIDITLHYLQLQVGYSGNPLLLDYTKWQHLATDSWIKALWESLHLFPIQLEMEYDDIPMPRQGDTTIMQFLHDITLTDTELARVNRCRNYLHLLFLSDITTADGTKLDADMIMGRRIPQRSKMKFPREEPSKLDWECWIKVWRAATRPDWKLAQPLGPPINHSHIIWTWFWDSDTESIFERSAGGLQRYAPPLTRRRTRGEQIFVPALAGRSSLPPNATPVSITRRSTMLHGTALMLNGDPGITPPPAPIRNDDVWDKLLSWGGTWMWSNLHFDRADKDLEWLWTAIQAGTTTWVTDGSFNVHRSPDISGAGWIVLDTESGRRFACSFAERSANAGSYRAELLGLYSIHLFLLAMEQTYPTTVHTKSNTISCDNLKALEKASEQRRRIPTWMKAPDILRGLRNTKRLLTVLRQYRHVAAHMDDVLSWKDLSLTQQLNVQCDLLAKAAVGRAQCALDNGLFPDTNTLPREPAALLINGVKLTSDPTKSLRHHIGRHLAKQYYRQELGWSNERFEQVCWESLHQALQSSSSRFSLWLTKQNSNFCASRKQLARITGSDDNRCPSCVMHIEDANHLCICPNEDRTLLLKQDTEALGTWLQQHDNSHPEIAYWVPKYILCRGKVRFSELGKMSPAMHRLAVSQDKIGWRNFMEGRITTEFGKMQQLHLLGSSSLLTTAAWTKTLVSKLLRITHSQWILRNFMLHNTLHGYLTMNDRLDLLRQVEHLLETSEDEIPEDRRFLLEFDMSDIADMDYNSQNYWVQAVIAARSASDKPRSDTTRTEKTGRPRKPPWKSNWGLAQVLEQIRKECGESRDSTHNWWGIRPDTLLVASRARESVPSRNASNKRRKPD